LICNLCTGNGIHLQNGQFCKKFQGVCSNEVNIVVTQISARERRYHQNRGISIFCEQNSQVLDAAGGESLHIRFGYCFHVVPVHPTVTKIVLKFY
jgi:hypothetical protein